MIQVEILKDGDPDSAIMTQWEAIPDVGERFNADGKEYTVLSRGWGVCWSGGLPVWNKQCVSIALTEIPKEP